MRIRGFGNKYRSFSNGLWTTWTKHDPVNPPTDVLSSPTTLINETNPESEKKKAERIGCIKWPKFCRKLKKKNNNQASAYVQQPNGSQLDGVPLMCPNCGGDLSNTSLYKDRMPDISTPVNKALGDRWATDDNISYTSSSAIWSGSPMKEREKLVRKRNSKNVNIEGNTSYNGIQINSEDMGINKYDYKEKRSKNRNIETSDNNAVNNIGEILLNESSEHNKLITTLTDLEMCDSDDHNQTGRSPYNNRLIDSLILGRQLN